MSLLVQFIDEVSDRSYGTGRAGDNTRKVGVLAYDGMHCALAVAEQKLDDLVRQRGRIRDL